MDVPVSTCSAWAALHNNDNTYYIHNDEEVIGRSEELLITIADPNVSRKHCVIRRTDFNTFTICDLSFSGTYLNGTRLEKNSPVNLNSSDRISILDRYSFKFSINKKRMAQNQTDTMTCSMMEALSSMENTYIGRMEKINEEINQMGKEKNVLEEEMGKQKSTKTKRETKSLASLKSKIKELNKRKEEMQKAKEDMEIQHKKERDELENKWKSDIEELKRKLKDSEDEKTRLEGTASEIEKMLIETKENLKESQLEQCRLFENTKTFEKEIQASTKQVEEKEKELKKTLEEINKIKSGVEGWEERLLCSICTEVFIDPYVLNCHHSFCKVCIDEWRKKKKDCPVCRENFKTCSKAFFYDAFIATAVNLMTVEARKQREELIKQREDKVAGKSAVPAKKRKKSTSQHIQATILRRINERLELPEPGPSTSGTLVTQVTQPTRGDPFEWNQPTGPRRSRTRSSTATSTPLESWLTPRLPVAAIDLTNVETPPPVSVTGTIDLTTP